MQQKPFNHLYVTAYMGQIVSINISKAKKTEKSPVEKAYITLMGLEGDAHSGDWHRQLSILALESIEKMKNMGVDVDVGDFAENITTIGIEVWNLEVGDRMFMGDAEIEITQKGKNCNPNCEIRNIAGDCVVPREGLFARVVKTGEIKKGDEVQVLKSCCQHPSGSAEI